MNQRSVPASTNPRNASAANASTTPNTTALRMRRQNPGDRVKTCVSGASTACDATRDPHGGHHLDRMMRVHSPRAKLCPR